MQKVIFADLTFITPSCRNWSGNDFYNTKLENLGFFLRIWGVKFRNFTISAKGHFRGFDFYKTKLNQKRGGIDFYNTKYSKIMEITPITPKRTWCYNQPPLYVNLVKRTEVASHKYNAENLVAYKATYAEVFVLRNLS